MFREWRVSCGRASSTLLYPSMFCNKTGDTARVAVPVGGAEDDVSVVLVEQLPGERVQIHRPEERLAS
ncbi:hypothetical protein GCM10020218_106700 [Dactylosporangium vinaceum]